MRGRAAVVMSLLQLVKLTGGDPWPYMKDVLTRMSTQLNSRLEECCPIGGSQHTELDPRRPSVSPTARLNFNTNSATTLHQRTATATALDHTARIRFTMAPMFAPGAGQFKMPRRDAYGLCVPLPTLRRRPRGRLRTARG